MANDYFRIQLKDGTKEYYIANYPETEFHICDDGASCFEVSDTSISDEAIEHSREDYDRIVTEIETKWSGVLIITSYVKSELGQVINFNRGIVKDIYK